MAAARQFDVTRAGDFLDDLLVERRRRGLIEFAADDQCRYFKMVKQRHEIGFLQHPAGGLKSLRIDPEQHFFSLLDLFRTRPEISRREYAFGRNLRDAA